MKPSNTQSTFWSHEPFRSLLPVLPSTSVVFFELAMNQEVPTNRTLSHCIVWLCLKNSYTIKQFAEIFNRDEKVIRYYCNKLVHDELLKTTKTGKRNRYTTMQKANTLLELQLKAFMKT